MASQIDEHVCYFLVKKIKTQFHITSKISSFMDEIL